MPYHSPDLPSAKIDTADSLNKTRVTKNCQIFPRRTASASSDFSLVDGWLIKNQSARLWTSGENTSDSF
jgi:hypothetical protein